MDQYLLFLQHRWLLLLRPLPHLLTLKCLSGILHLTLSNLYLKFSSDSPAAQAESSLLV